MASRWLTVIVAAAAVLTATVSGRTECRDCHQDQPAISPYHGFKCVKCHGGDNRAKKKALAHRGLIANPTRLDFSGKYCGACHGRDVQSVKASLMATAAGIINATRYLWGAQKSIEPRFATTSIGKLRRLPPPEGSLVDDLLRRRCLRCHLNTKGAKRRGDYRSAGCAACHVVYDDEGKRKHRFTTAVPTRQCLHCHNGPRIGADYVGLYPRDFHRAYRFPGPGKKRPKRLHGQDYRRLIPDVHYQRGLHCIDCHPKPELMGSGRVPGRVGDQVRVRCFDCHGRPGKPPKTVVITQKNRDALRAARMNPKVNLKPGDRVAVTSGGHLLTHVRFKNGRLTLTSRVTGKTHIVPPLWHKKHQPLAHRMGRHIDRVACHACHAAWTSQDFGFHLFREDYANYYNWHGLTGQDDPQVQRILEKYLALPVSKWRPPRSKDWLTGLWYPGVWYQGYSYRRWEGRIMGVNRRGQVALLRPRYQFVITHVGRDRLVRKDSVIPRTADGRRGWAMNPHAPHTIQKMTVGCRACHGNPRAAGLGNRELLTYRATKKRPIVLSPPLTYPGLDGLEGAPEFCQVVTLKGVFLQTTTRPGARLLNQGEIRGLLTFSKAYRRYRLRRYRAKRWLQWLRPKTVRPVPATIKARKMGSQIIRGNRPASQGIKKRVNSPNKGRATPAAQAGR